jgi:hypothetical protein
LLRGRRLGQRGLGADGKSQRQQQRVPTAAHVFPLQFVLRPMVSVDPILSSTEIWAQFTPDEVVDSVLRALDPRE